MAKEHYLPSTDAEKVTWLQNFAGKLSGYSVTFGLTTAVPHCTDTHPLPPGTAAVWKYRAIYRIGDERVGQWSDVFTCAVRG